MADGPHPLDALHELLDGRLDGSARAAVDAHLGGCEPCRRELDLLRWSQRAVRAAEAELPPGLEQRVRAALDAEDARTATTTPGIRWWLLPAAAALVIGFVLAGLLGRTGREIPARVAADFRDYEAGRLELALVAGEVGPIQAFFAASGIELEARVFDLAMMGIHPVGGRVHEVGGRPSALFVYRDAEGHVYVCQMYPGRVSALPPEAEMVEHDGITFRVYDVDGVTAVFWQEGEVVCVLAGSLSRNAVVQLAFAKAMKV